VPVGEQTVSCLSIPFSVDGKKRKSTTTATFESTSRVDADHTVIRNLDTSDELSEDSMEPSKRRRHSGNSTSSGSSL